MVAFRGEAAGTVQPTDSQDEFLKMEAEAAAAAQLPPASSAEESPRDRKKAGAYPPERSILTAVNKVKRTTSGGGPADRAVCLQS